MNKLMIRFLCLTIALIVFSATDARAQKSIKLDKNGAATVRTTVKPLSTFEWLISGKGFRTLAIKQTNDGKFKYEIRRGGEFLSSGHTTGSNIQVKSDGNSTYKLRIINEENDSRPIVLSIKDLESDDK
ncbi:MAG: hypothetical protein WBO10_10125 [Pyrinomonadaceae bacterium]